MAGVFNFKSQRAKIRIDRILAILEREQLTVRELAARLHSSKSAINHYIKHLHAEPKRIFIAGYAPGSQRGIALYTKGDQEDAPYQKKSKGQYWQEVKADPERLAATHAVQARVRAKKRGREHLLRQCKKYDPPLLEQVKKYVEMWPGSTTRQIAERIDATFGGVKQAVSELKRSGILTFEKRTREGAFWELASRKKVRHAPVVVKPQGIFAALGV